MLSQTKIPSEQTTPRSVIRTRKTNVASRPYPAASLPPGSITAIIAGQVKSEAYWQAMSSLSSIPPPRFAATPYPFSDAYDTLQGPLVIGSQSTHSKTDHNSSHQSTGYIHSISGGATPGPVVPILRLGQNSPRDQSGKAERSGRKKKKSPTKVKRGEGARDDVFGNSDS